MSKHRSKGFTLIELLVVIAIIGILSGIVLVGLNLTRDRARDARVKEELANLRAVAENYYIDNNTYLVDINNGNTVCTEDIGGSPTAMGQALASIRGLTSLAGCDVNPNGTTWLALAHLPSDDEPISFGGFNFNPAAALWCVDSSGFSGEISLGELLAVYTSSYLCR